MTNLTPSSPKACAAKLRTSRFDLNPSHAVPRSHRQTPQTYPPPDIVGKPQPRTAGLLPQASTRNPAAPITWPNGRRRPNHPGHPGTVSEKAVIITPDHDRAVQQYADNKGCNQSPIDDSRPTAAAN